MTGPITPLGGLDEPVSKEIRMLRTVRTRVFLALAATLFAGALATAWAQAPLVVFGDMVYGHENPPEGASCTLNNRFLPGQMVVFRIRVLDPMDGSDMDDATLASVELQLADGQTFAMTFGEHPPREPVDAYWTAGWVIPDGYPSGVLEYTVVATALDGRVGELITFPIDTSTLTILPN